jgi:hypothetical protein
MLGIATTTANVLARELATLNQILQQRNFNIARQVISTGCNQRNKTSVS